MVGKEASGLLTRGFCVKQAKKPLRLLTLRLLLFAKRGRLCYENSHRRKIIAKIGNLHGHSPQKAALFAGFVVAALFAVEVSLEEKVFSSASFIVCDKGYTTYHMRTISFANILFRGNPWKRVSNMGITQVAKTVSYKEKIYEEIKTAIINQVLKPGEQLNERALAEKLGISRTPLREAFKRLETEGWVVTEARRGTYVTEITEQDIEEVFQLRMALEVMVIELIIQKIAPGQLLNMKKIHQNQAKLGDECKAGDFIEQDRKFHLYLAELTGNKKLLQILANLSDMMRRLGVAALHTAERYQETLQEHSGIIEALEMQDLAKAKQAVLSHVLNTQKAAYRHWRDQNFRWQSQA